MTKEEAEKIGTQILEAAKRGDAKNPIGWILSFVISILRGSGMQKEHIHNLVEHNIMIADKALEAVEGK